MEKVLRQLCFLLDRFYEKTRIVQWPAGAPLRIAVVAQPDGGPLLGQCLDAIEAFHPGSKVWLYGQPAPAAAQLSQLRRQFSAQGSLELSLGDDAAHRHPFDALISLRSEHNPPRDQQPFHRTERPAPPDRPRAQRQWILFPDQSLWDGGPSSRAARFLLNLLRKPLHRWITRRDQSVLEKNVLPFLADAARWRGAAPCRHARAARVFSRPKVQYFCPECGMGFTPADQRPANEELAQLYGAGYAVYGHYLGRREFLRRSEGAIADLNRYLDKLAFTDNSTAERPRTVLDYGCGNGRFGLAWLRRGWRYVGVDPSAQSIHYAEAFLKDAAPGAPAGQARLLCGDLDSPAIQEAGPFDLVFLSHVLEHVEEPLELLRRLRKVCRAGGAIYAEVPHAANFCWNLHFKGYQYREHFWDYTPPALEAILSAAGWQVTQSYVMENPQCPYFALLARNPMMEQVL